MSLIVCVGVIGYSVQSFDTEVARKYLVEDFDIISNLYEGYKIEIVSGLTDLGIPALAYREAEKRGWKTVGIACRKACDYKEFPCDERHIIGTEWGDESQKFLDRCHVFIRIGGGKNALRELAQIRKMEKPVFDHDLPAI